MRGHLLGPTASRGPIFRPSVQGTLPNLPSKVVTVCAAALWFQQNERSKRRFKVTVSCLQVKRSGVRKDFLCLFGKKVLEGDFIKI